MSNVFLMSISLLMNRNYQEVNLYIHFKKWPVLQVSFWFCLYSTHYVFYIIINAVLFGHFTYLYGTVIILYLLYFLLPSWPDASVSVYTWISEGYIKVTLPKVIAASTWWQEYSFTSKWLHIIWEITFCMIHSSIYLTTIIIYLYLFITFSSLWLMLQHPS